MCHYCGCRQIPLIRDFIAEHISREEDGLFPATLVTLSGPQWDESIAAWEAAHPGRRLRTD